MKPTVLSWMCLCEWTLPCPYMLLFQKSGSWLQKQSCWSFASNLTLHLSTGVSTFSCTITCEGPTTVSCFVCLQHESAVSCNYAEWQLLMVVYGGVPPPLFLSILEAGKTRILTIVLVWNSVWGLPDLFLLAPRFWLQILLSCLAWFPNRKSALVYLCSNSMIWFFLAVLWSKNYVLVLQSSCVLK